jgi:hypothetical protein
MIAAILALAGCASIPPDSQRRAISEDIDAAHDNGATLHFPGLNSGPVPETAFSWHMD